VTLQQRRARLCALRPSLIRLRAPSAMDVLGDPDEGAPLKRQRPSGGLLSEMVAPEEAGAAAPAVPPLRPSATDEAALRRAAGQKNMDRCASRARSQRSALGGRHALGRAPWLGTSCLPWC
jgi:hypothetical protein